MNSCVSIFPVNDCPSSRVSRSKLPRIFWLVVLGGICIGELIDVTSLAATGDGVAVLQKPWRRDGEKIIKAFEGLASQLRDCVVKIDVDGVTVGLGTVVDHTGLVATKASQIRSGTLTCWLAGGREVPAEMLESDTKNDVALIRVKADGLKSIRWASEKVFIGQWAVSQGIEQQPQTVGVVSSPPRRIYPPRAFAGVELSPEEGQVSIARIMPGLGAEKAGLQAGDVILAVQGATVKSRAELTGKLRPYTEGQTVKLRVRRGAKEWDVSVVLSIPSFVRESNGGSRQDRMNRFGSELSERVEGFDSVIQHDSVLQGWECGGPLLNLDGKAIGLNIARAGRVASYALPASLAQRVIGDLISKARKRQPKL